MTSFTQPEVHNVSQIRNAARGRPNHGPATLNTRRENLLKYGYAVFNTRADTQTHRHVHHNTTQYSAVTD